MRSHRFVAACALVALVWLSSGGSVWAEARLPEANASAERFVQAALKSAIDGPTELRKDLLDQALACDPNYAPARWQSGFVRWDNQWLSVDEVARRTVDDKNLAAYRKRRGSMVDTADEHRAMAAWCHKHKLLEEEKVHWAKVLEFEPADPEALAGLGLQVHEGRLLTRQQIELAKKKAAEQRRSTASWQPKLVKWRADVEHGADDERERALSQLRKIEDPGAIAALVAVFGAKRATPASSLLLIETLGHMPQLEATEVLLAYSLVPDSQALRAAAADQLKKRPMHSYVPRLIAALPGTLSTKFHVTILPNGTVVHQHEVLIEGRTANISMTYDAATSASDPLAGIPAIPGAASDAWRNAAAIETSARVTQANLDFVRNRVQFVLERTTGFANVNDPQLWDKQYNEYNGWHTPEQSKPTFYESAYDYRGYATPPVDAVLSNSPPRPAGPMPRHSYCFAAGTPIVTAYGPRPIESIKAGDRVLAQDGQTGELTFKPVQTTTLRSTNELLSVSLGSDSILTTPGHPFWVIGDGWRVVKRLKAGDRLHGLNGPVAVDRVEPVTPREVYNLVVSQFHDYFVGRSALLAHDDVPLFEAAAKLPGFAASKAP